VRTSSTSIGYIEYTAMPNWPGKKPKPNESFGAKSPAAPLLSRSNPEYTPVFDGAL